MASALESNGRFNHAPICYAPINIQVAGFSLMELMIGMSLSIVLMTGVVQLLAGSTAAYRVQLNLSQMEESSQFARNTLARDISQAGYQHEPWLSEDEMAAITSDSQDSHSVRGDQLGVQRRSRKNCFGNDNPTTDSHGRPAFYLLKTSFRINASKNLAMTCAYGPEPAKLVRQINALGLVEDVEAMRVQFAEDRDGDGIADTWVWANMWHAEENIKAIRVALLLATGRAIGHYSQTPLTLLDEPVTVPSDGRFRRVTSFTVPIRGRQ